MIFTDEERAIDIASRYVESAQSGDLVSAAQAGSSIAFAELREIYARRVYRKLLTITKNHEDAEDALQDAFLRAYLAIHSFEGRSSFYSWLTRIGINSALMILRKRRARPEVSFDRQHEMDEEDSVIEFKDAGPSPEQICVHRQRCARALTSIGKLQPRLREVVELHLGQSRSVKEIAQALEISEAAVKSRLFRARVRLTSSHTLQYSEVRARRFGGSRPEGHAA